jgi:catalase
VEAIWSMSAKLPSKPAKRFAVHWTKIGLAVAVALPFAWASPAAIADEDAPLGERLVDVMNQLFGGHPGLRPMHTKGLVVEGTFTPSGAGAALSKAALFQGAPTPVTARFSDATGLPAIADGDPNANPHGLGIRFHLADGGEMDVVTNSLTFFPVATGEEFLGLLQAVAASGPDAAKPTPLERFVAAHPTVPRAFASTSTPASYARETYNGVNAFVFVDAAGQRHPFRFRLVPVAGEEHLSAGDAARRAPTSSSTTCGPRWPKARCASASWRSSPGRATPRPTRPSPGRTTASWSTWARSR